MSLKKLDLSLTATNSLPSLPDLSYLTLRDGFTLKLNEGDTFACTCDALWLHGALTRDNLQNITVLVDARPCQGGLSGYNFTSIARGDICNSLEGLSKFNITILCVCTFNVKQNH